MKSIADYNKANFEAPTASASLARGTGSLALPTLAPKQQKPGFAKCSNNGCKKIFEKATNTETACNFHPGNPIFGGNEKRWACCPEHAYWEFELFQKIPPCKTGNHVDELEHFKQLLQFRATASEEEVGLTGNVHAQMGY